ncbi:nitrogen regulation protein NR(II), partial [Nitrospirota bacterium]
QEYADELEDLVQKRTSELSSEKEKLDAVVSSISAGIGIFDNMGNCVWVNKVLDEWLSEEVKKDLKLNDLYGSSDGEPDIWNAVVEDKVIQVTSSLSFGNKSGTFQVAFTPFHLPDGSFQILMLLQDITELRLAEEQMVQSDKLAALSRLSAGVAHEIGNPLTSISSYVQILKDMDFDEFTSNSLSTILKHISRIETILKKMSSFTRSKEDEVRSYDLRELIDSTVELVKYDKRTKHMNIVVDIPVDLPFIKVNGNQMIQIIMNLVLNAADAMNDGGTLSVTATAESGGVDVFFSDTGPGIDVEHLDRIFDPFFTTKKTGTGLGLAVSMSIVKSFGGELDVLSEPDKGTTFIVRLPAHETK